MPDIITHRDFKDISSDELFVRFVEGLKTRDLPQSFRESPPWTKLAREVLRELGEDLGYEVRDQDIIGEFLALDQTWRVHEKALVQTYLAMEQENTSDVEDVVNDEIEKLVDVKSEVKVLITYTQTESWNNHLNLIENRINIGNSSQDERYLLIFMTTNAQRVDDFMRYTELTVSGFELRKGKTHRKIGNELKIQKGA